ncbi:MAG: glutamine--fructose-6-phosphate transaminase (isomerizing), partial [archaeon]|nr:glutamine--fructose-6-phosphate transaminase (isomerizing) [archaeon]
MCGIIGVISNNNAPFKAIAGLKRLEYRGYDSWGISFKNCDHLETIREVGRIKIPERGTLNHNSYAAIAHTRWATHGKVTKENAHPHKSNDGEFIIAHNGIVENYVRLKKDLEQKGFTFYSQTDSEVIVNLIQYNYSDTKNFTQAVKKTISMLDGSYAIVCMHNKSFEMVCARNGSPLVIGVGDHEFFAASDVSAFLQYTKKVIYLKDNELAVLGKDVTITDLATGGVVEPVIKEIAWTAEQAEKGEYEYFMLKEINEQPQTIQRAGEQDAEKLEKITQMIKDAKGVFFVGCGTSYHSCITASYLFSSVAKMHVNTVIASEFRNYEDFLKPETLIIAVSQSGETADVLDAVKAARSKGSKVVSIVNVMDSTLMRHSDESLLMNSGPEICVLSTKTYTSQLALLTLLCYSVAGRMDEGKKIVKAAAEKSRHVLEYSQPIAKELAKKLSGAKDFFLIGRDLAYPSAIEGALKIKEVSYIHAEGFPGGELKHGSIALIEEGVPAIV